MSMYMLHMYMYLHSTLQYGNVVRSVSCYLATIMNPINLKSTEVENFGKIPNFKLKLLNSFTRWSHGIGIIFRLTKSL